MSSSCTNSSLVIPINYHLTNPLSANLPPYFYFVMLLLYLVLRNSFHPQLGALAGVTFWQLSAESCHFGVSSVLLVLHADPFGRLKWWLPY